jgi:hypothetical protein
LAALRSTGLGQLGVWSWHDLVSFIASLVILSFFSGFFFLLPKGVTVYSAPQKGMINVLSHPQLMDMIEQAEVSYKKLPGTA